MEIWDIAHTFDMNVKEFCALFGYSRQALYMGCIGRKDRKDKAIQKLIDRNKDMLTADRQAAEDKFRKRANAIRELDRMLSKRRYVK